MSERAANNYNGASRPQSLGRGVGDHLQAGGYRIRPASPGERDAGVGGRDADRGATDSATARAALRRRTAYDWIVAGACVAALVAIIVWRITANG